ncbi:MAG TPA: biopolymer transporter ExbD [Candidatus Hydrogenedentes bacterium]|nr:biopolymer transporter ExbD [Candidatus Hydrogenedentota bacterium]
MKRVAETQISEINITPLTDIFLVLLIIMMIVTPMLEYSGLNLAMLSGSSDTKTKQKSKYITIYIAQDGKYTIKDHEIERVLLPGELRYRLQDNPEGVIIMVHPEAPYDAMAYAAASATQIGIQRISFKQEDISETSPAPETKPDEKK